MYNQIILSGNRYAPSTAMEAVRGREIRKWKPQRAEDVSGLLQLTCVLQLDWTEVGVDVQARIPSHIWMSKRNARVRSRDKFVSDFTASTQVSITLLEFQGSESGHSLREYSFLPV